MTGFTHRKPRILVVGVGGIGGTLAGTLLADAGDAVAEVVGLTTNAEVASEIDRHGYRLSGTGGQRVVRGLCATALPADTPPFDWAFLATQPPHVEAAARSALPLLRPGGAMVCFQNGLCELRVANIVGADRVVGAVVAWGANSAGPGQFERSTAGGFTIGRMDGVADPRLAELATLLEYIGPVNLAVNLAGARWSKLAINCGISTLGTIGGNRLGVLMRLRVVRRLCLDIMTEVVAVARAEGVQLEKVSGTLDLDWMALTDNERIVSGSAGLLAKHTLLLAVGTRYRNLRSSMLRAIEQGKPPAVDFLNGEIVTRGRRHGVPTPVNEAATALVHAIARGERGSSEASLRWLYDETASVRGA